MAPTTRTAVVEPSGAARTPLPFLKMRLFLLGIGGSWLVMAALVALELVLSPRHRGASRRLDSRPLLTLAAMIIVGVGSVVAGLLSPPSLALAVVCMTPMLVLGVIQRRQLRERDDLPPPLARMLEVPVNPLTHLRHPIRTTRAQWAAMGHPICSRREMRAWQNKQPRN